MTEKILAVDLGGTKIAVARVGRAGLLDEPVRMPAARTVEGTLRQVAEAAAAAPCRAVAISLPGIYDASQRRCWAPNLWGPDWQEAPRLFEARLGIPVFWTSDRTACVLGESWLGVARGLAHVVFVAVGTGIGVGILGDGRPLEGARGIAGAAGWMTLSRRWRAEYGRCGCWEAEAAGPGAAVRGGFPNGESMARAALAGDARAIRGMERAARWLGAGIANLVSLLDPEMVVLGGSFGLSPALPLPVLEREMRRWAQPVSAARVRLERSQLGPAAPLLGAARLAFTALKGAA